MIRRFYLLLTFVCVGLISCEGDRDGTNRINVVCVGNSLTFGDGAAKGKGYPEQLSDLLSDKFSVSNKGVSGQTTPEMQDDFLSKIAPLYDTISYKENTLIVWEARNDLIVNEVSPDKAFKNLEQYCLTAKNQGWKVIVIGLLPSWKLPPYKGDATVNGYLHLDSDRIIVNQILEKNFKKFADGYVDINDDRIGSLGDNENPGYVWSEVRPTANIYYNDGTHMTAEGYRIIAELVKQELLKSTLP